ncbi:MAG: enoyl-CoA hydratase [Alicyclobacillus sp.]|nr:enoyl-CoA hydratase [Alicyclobacillus sp.]
MPDPLVLRADDAGVVTLTLNRADSANALSQALLREMIGHLRDVAADSAVRVVCMTGAGDKAFCAGADLKERRGMDENQVRQAVGLIREMVERVASLPQPVIAAVNGVAFGGGTELALAADLRIAARHAQLGLTETSLAIIPGAGGTQRLARIVGLAKAKELIFTARRIDAEGAWRMGLVNEVVDGADLQKRALELAREIAANGPIAVRAAKFAIDRGYGHDLASGLQVEWVAYERTIPTEDRLEGLAAFAEKRKPLYKGK